MERQRLAEEEKNRWARLKAPQLIADNSGGGNGVNPVGGTSDPSSNASRAVATLSAEDDPNKAFLLKASGAGVDTAQATKNTRIDALVAQGTTIRGVLETALQSDLPGMVRAITTEDVYSFDGRRILIPTGTRLVGEYKSGLSVGQTRVFVVWTRLLRADGVSVQLGSNGTDELGRAGNSGIIDNHYVERFGSAIVLSIAGGVTQYISSIGQKQPQQQQSSTQITDSVTGAVTTIQNQPNVSQGQAQQIAATQVSQSLTNIAQQALKSSINIPPTIYLDQGTRIIVFVRRDLDFSAFYPDPLKEALREIKRERGYRTNSLSR